MDDNRPPPSPCNFHLLCKRLLLLFPGRVVIIIIETYFPHREDLRVSQQIVQFFECSPVSQLGLMGVDAGCGQDAGSFCFAGIPLAQFQRLLHGVWPVADANGQNRTHTLLPGPLEQLIPVGVVSRAVKVCV